MFFRFIIVIYITIVLFSLGYLQIVSALENNNLKEEYSLDYKRYSNVKYLKELNNEHKKNSELIKDNETLGQQKREERNYLVKRNQDDGKNISISVEYEEEKPSE